MAQAYAILVFILVLNFFVLAIVRGSENSDDEQLDPLLVRSLLSTDFEDGMGEWFDYSSGDVNWYLEAFDSPIENPAPHPANGSKYLRVVHREAGSAGTAILRSPTFTAYPGDEITFKFWIRSRHLQANNLEVYWLNGTREELLVSLSEYSSPSNFEWRSVSAQIPTTTATDTKIIIYGYCGYNEEDSIAIDDITVGSASSDSTTTVADSVTTTAPPTTAGSSCPQYLGGLSHAPCFDISTGCYCLYKESYNSDGASGICRRYGMTLVSLETPEEDTAVVNLLLDQELFVHYHTSGRYNSSERIWRWGSGMRFEYNHWASSEPNGSGSCMYLSTGYSFRWADISCQINFFFFICEK